MCLLYEKISMSHPFCVFFSLMNTQSGVFLPKTSYFSQNLWKCFLYIYLSEAKKHSDYIQFRFKLYFTICLYPSSPSLSKTFCTVLPTVLIVLVNQGQNFHCEHFRRLTWRGNIICLKYLIGTMPPLKLLFIWQEVSDLF